MDTSEYLTVARDMYLQGVMSDETPEMLRDLGGPLSLAGADMEGIRVEKNGFLGFIDKQRSLSEAHQRALSKWREHSADVRQRVAKGLDVETAFLAHTIQTTGIQRHFGPQRLQNATQPARGQLGTKPSWLYDIVIDRERFMSELELVTDTIPAAAAGVDYIAARLLHRDTSATQEERGAQERRDMESALATARFLQPVARGLEAAVGVIDARATSLFKPPLPDRPRIIETAPKPNELRLSGKGRDARGIGDRSTHPSQNGTHALPPAGRDARSAPAALAAAALAAAAEEPARPTRTRGLRKSLDQRANLDRMCRCLTLPP